MFCVEALATAMYYFKVLLPFLYCYLQGITLNYLIFLYIVLLLRRLLLGLAVMAMSSFTV